MVSGPEQIVVQPWYRNAAHFARYAERRRRE